ncbi:OsmC family protein [Hydrogenophaga taeniospiralis]|uniref:OsmC family protein n=1 Tax=Hydrogenophaga taeniospiralis TaxID=65656 RepID=UPI0008C3FE3E|nr:OsmC family protein [Hydrogenophaga taeniospiralis]MCB4366119.1 OsmC family protein [Hydrogenophaga taeniospiralis]OGB16385.1 MAG: peroxiredoxin [Burkholderiales bacterium RIFCSPLOWO2_02_FULL_67_64]OGB40447.1 MAG: peroxiredoxin [Burkholderiales bacterium RIFCSPHIGHO2_12_FULL_67_38]OGB42787.1 MAG: peroxiredoxin [Burkholderiales bacterium RIFCSPLOWO2_12_67_14]
MSDNASVTITRQSGYQFLVDFGAAIPSLLADEPAPLGQGAGPAPDHLLLAAVANCLSASLLFSLQKFKQDPGTLVATATPEMGRNENKRLRIVGIHVKLELGQAAASIEHLDRVLAQFEEFCTVSMSVRQGIPIHVQVQDGTGAILKD